MHAGSTHRDLMIAEVTTAICTARGIPKTSPKSWRFQSAPSRAALQVHDEIPIALE
jgi:hypothetical protein